MAPNNKIRYRARFESLETWIFEFLGDPRKAATSIFGPAEFEVQSQEAHTLVLDLESRIA